MLDYCLATITRKAFRGDVLQHGKSHSLSIEVISAERKISLSRRITCFATMPEPESNRFGWGHDPRCTSQDTAVLFILLPECG